MLNNILLIFIGIINIFIMLFLVTYSKVFALILLALVVLAIIFPEKITNMILKKIKKILSKVMNFIGELIAFITTEILF